MKNVKKPGKKNSSGGLLVGVSQFKGIVLMKLLESQNSNVLQKSFKLSFDLAFLFIKGFFSRIGLVFLLYYLNKWLNTYWKKFQVKIGILDPENLNNSHGADDGIDEKQLEEDVEQVREALREIGQRQNVGNLGMIGASGIE